MRQVLDSKTVEPDPTLTCRTNLLPWGCLTHGICFPVLMLVFRKREQLEASGLNLETDRAAIMFMLGNRRRNDR